VWMERNLDLPGDMARLLVDAARRQT
jgi:hypothetical protein